MYVLDSNGGLRAIPEDYEPQEGESILSYEEASVLLVERAANSPFFPNYSTGS